MRECTICKVLEKDCKRIINSPIHGIVCDICYQRERANKITHELPNYGEINYDEEGNPICHICGKAYKKLMSHVWQVHEISAREYKEKFGLEVGKGIMSKESTELARKRAYENEEKVIHENLIRGGKHTRYVEGHKGRTKDMVSEYTRKRLVKQAKSISRK